MRVRKIVIRREAILNFFSESADFKRKIKAQIIIIKVIMEKLYSIVAVLTILFQVTFN